MADTTAPMTQSEFDEFCALWASASPETRAALAKHLATMEQPATRDELQRLPILPWAVFDEHGDPADDRVQDYGLQCWRAALAAQQPAIPPGMVQISREQFEQFTHWMAQGQPAAQQPAELTDAQIDAIHFPGSTVCGVRQFARAVLAAARSAVPDNARYPVAENPESEELAGLSVAELLRRAQRDSDPVSTFTDGESWDDAGAMACIVKPGHARAVHELLTAHGFITPGKPVADQIDDADFWTDLASGTAGTTGEKA